VNIPIDQARERWEGSGPLRRRTPTHRRQADLPRGRGLGEAQLHPRDHSRITGTLVIADQPRGLVLFAHGSGSSRFSPRNRFVADSLHRAGFGTLLVDLLTPEEERFDAATGHLRFDIELLANRLIAATDRAAAAEAPH
jgi:putative phosphoribosyl transferase